ncbi:MAG: beta-1,6-N-acetylglucosaminyltransferase [Pseudomonadota bacterium]
MRIAHLILAHKDLDQLARLVDVLRHPGHCFFIHLDARAPCFAQAVAHFAKAADVTLVTPRVRCRWGHFSLVEATLQGLRTVMAQATPFDHVNLISGQDYPLKRPAEMERYLAARPGCQFINFFPLHANNPWTQQGGPYQALQRIEGVHLAFRSRWLHLPLKRKMPNGWTPYGGSQWWTLTGPCVQWLMQRLEQQPAIKRFFRHTFIPDELFFQTLIMNSPFAEQAVNDNLRYVDFSRANPTPPAVLLEADYGELLQVDKLFARKLEPRRSHHLMALIDRHLLGRDQPVEVREPEQAH